MLEKIFTFLFYAMGLIFAGMAFAVIIAAAWWLFSTAHYLTYG